MGLKKLKRRYTPEARRLIQKCPPAAKTQLRALIEEVSEDPLIGKELQDPLSGFRSARYARWRIIYEYNEETQELTIHYVGRRQNIYELFERLVKRYR